MDRYCSRTTVASVHNVHLGDCALVERVSKTTAHLDLAVVAGKMECSGAVRDLVYGRTARAAVRRSLPALIEAVVAIHPGLLGVVGSSWEERQRTVEEEN